MIAIAAGGATRRCPSRPEGSRSTGWLCGVLSSEPLQLDAVRAEELHGRGRDHVGRCGPGRVVVAISRRASSGGGEPAGERRRGRRRAQRRRVHRSRAGRTGRGGPRRALLAAGHAAPPPLKRHGLATPAGAQAHRRSSFQPAYRSTASGSSSSSSEVGAARHATTELVERRRRWSRGAQKSVGLSFLSVPPQTGEELASARWRVGSPVE